MNSEIVKHLILIEHYLILQTTYILKEKINMLLYKILTSDI